MNENFYKNIQAIENMLFKSQSFKYLETNELEKGTIATIIIEIYKQAINGALNLAELELKTKNENLAHEKAKMEIELNILNAKAQIKTAQAEAIKSLIQAKSMIRSVVDNAAINRANGYVGLANVIGNATEQKALTAPALSGGMAGGISTLAAENIEKINIKAITEFDDLLNKLISDNNFISKDVTIYSEKRIILQGESIILEGISSFIKNENKFLINGVEVAKNCKNYFFEAKQSGEFLVSFLVKDDENNWLKDTIKLKVIENNTTRDLPPLKKF